jgi:S1-C subfamily serine protease
VLVLEVEPDSPAARASLRGQDVIVSLAGRQVASASQIADALTAIRPGQAVEVTFLRQGRRGKTTVVL